MSDTQTHAHARETDPIQTKFGMIKLQVFCDICYDSKV